MKLLLLGLSLLAALGNDSRSPVTWRKTVRVLSPFECECTPGVTPTINTSDACCDVEVLVQNPSEAGVCDCEEYDEVDCIMGSVTARYKLHGGACACTKMDVTQIGDDSGPTALNWTLAMGWTDAFTTGGFALGCTLSESGMGQGGVRVTCTEGGDPVPRTMVSVDYAYECEACMFGR